MSATPDPPPQQTAGPQTTTVAFRTRGLTKVYKTGDTEVHALRGVDLDINEGELVVLLGPSGSGKSTLLNVLGGIDTPTGGTATFRDIELSNANDRTLTAYRRNHVGFIFQFYNLMPSLTAAENVALVTEIADNPMPADDALALVGLADRTKHFPSQMSGGQQQRVAVARAVAKRPDVLLCDEPTGALDSVAGNEILSLLQQLNQRGTAIVMITHSPEVAAASHRTLELVDGSLQPSPVAVAS